MAKADDLEVLRGAVALTQHMTKPGALQMNFATPGLARQAEIVLANYLDVLDRVHAHLRATRSGRGAGKGGVPPGARARRTNR